MSWLGVNLNESLSSIKGQISNFTRDVLSEDFDGEDDSQVVVSRDRIKELESLCQLQKHELEELKRARSEVEERLHAADLHASHQNKLLKQQLQGYERELRILRSKSMEWGWEEGEKSIHSSSSTNQTFQNHTPIDEIDARENIANRNHLFLCHSGDENLELKNKQLCSRIEELEREICSQRDYHQEQIAALQDQHRQYMLRVTQKDCVPGSNSTTSVESEDGLPEERNESKEALWQQVQSKLEEEKEELRCQVEILQNQVQRMKGNEKLIGQQEEKILALNEECSRLKGENEQLIKNLEEVDIQHQAVFDQILKKKQTLQEELQTNKVALNELSQQALQNDVDKDALKSEIERLQEEVQTIRAEKSSSFISLEEKIETATLEHKELREQLLTLRNKEISLDTKLQEAISEREQLLQGKEDLKNKLRELKSIKESQEEARELKSIKESQRVNQEMENFKTKCMDLEQTNAQLQASVQSTSKELSSLKASEASAHELLKACDAKRLSGDLEITKLRSEIGDLTEQLSRANVAEDESKALNAKMVEIENERQREQIVIEDRFSSKYKRTNQALVDANSRIEFMESKLQAKEQELDISNERIVDLQSKHTALETEFANYKKHTKEYHEHVKELLKSHNTEITDNMEKDLLILGDLVRDSIWQRDTLERRILPLTQELREKTDQLQEAESLRSDLEHECEELQEQLEEAQQGIRLQPEGSSGRALPTIEEETEGCADGEGGEILVANPSQAIGKESVKPNFESVQKINEIEELQLQVQVLSEARRNFETEVTSMRREIEQLQGQLQEAESRIGNLANLETEAAALRAEKSALELKLNTFTKKTDCETVVLKDERDALEERIKSLEEDNGTLQAEITLNNYERESIGQQLLVQYEIVEKKEAVIRVLEGEVEGLKETMREKFANHNPLKYSELTTEMNNLRSQIIFKDDRIDELAVVLDQINQVFVMEGFHPDRLPQHIKYVISTNEKKLQEQQHEIEDLTKTLQHERDQLSSERIRLESESSLRADKELEVTLLKEKLEKSEIEVFQLREKFENLMPEPQVNSAEFLKLKELYENLLDQKMEALVNLEQRDAELLELKQEAITLRDEVAKRKESLLILSQEKDTLINNHERFITHMQYKHQEMEEKMADQTKAYELDISEKGTHIISLQSQLTELQKDNTAVALYVNENHKLVTKEKMLQDENESFQQKVKKLEEERENLLKEREETSSGKDNFAHQLNSLTAERNQMIATITQKHQESVTYHAEIQRLMQVLSQTVQSSEEEKTLLSSKLSATEVALAERRTQMKSLRKEVEDLKKVIDNLQQTMAKKTVQETEVLVLRKEIEGLQSQNSNVEQERDQLRIANAHFNTQYQDQSKELSNIREKESRLAAECERLRQHLVEVEESYTSEAIRTEERESTLRSTLAKMEEKLNNHSSFYNSASHRASVQVDTLQEQVREVSAERDDALDRLRASEEMNEQHQQSLATLQQVLQDFQKGQVREIAEATERTRRQLEEEREGSKLLTVQITNLNKQLVEVQTALAAASRLGEQLDRKEQMICTLKSQVTSQEEVARKARDEVMCLKTSSEGKIEKTLLRNLLVGYFATPTDKRNEVLRVIAEVLDFSGEERARTGLDLQGKSWLSSIANFLAPPASNIHVTSKVDILDHTSLSQAFIRFLEDESAPRHQARFPAVQMAQQSTDKAEKKAQAKAQAANMKNPLVSVGETASISIDRSEKYPVLAAASMPPSLLMLTSAAPTPSPLAEQNSLDSATEINMPPISTNKYLTTLLGSEGNTKENGK